MRILMVQRHFWPDVGVPATQFRLVASRLAAEGHQVTVLCSQPSHNAAFRGARPPRYERVDGIEIRRLPLPPERKSNLAVRLLEVMSFVVGTAAHLLRRPRSYDLVMTTSVPPVLLPAAVRLYSRLTGTPYTYRLQDLVPEGALATGLMRPGALTRLLGWIDRRNCERAAAVVTVSDDVATAIADRGLDSSNVVVIRDFLTFSFGDAPPLPAALAKPSGAFRVLHAGSLGPPQGLESLIEAAQRLSDIEQIEFAFVGAGVEAARLEELAARLGCTSVRFFPHQSPGTALAMMHDADLGVVSLAPGVYRVGFPSKLAAYLEADTRVLAVVEGGSDLARLVRDSDIGAVCANDPAAIAAAIRAEIGGSRPQEAGRVRAVGRRMFAPNPHLERWSELVAEVGAPHSRHGKPTMKQRKARRTIRP